MSKYQNTTPASQSFAMAQVHPVEVIPCESSSSPSISSTVSGSHSQAHQIHTFPSSTIQAPNLEHRSFPQHLLAGAIIPTSHLRTSIQPEPSYHPQTTLLSPFSPRTVHSTPTMAPQHLATAYFAPKVSSGSHSQFQLPGLRDLPGRQPGQGSSYGELMPSRPKARVDAYYVERLYEAMKDTSQAEDNPQMISTWNKLMKSKPDKIKRLCATLLVR